MEEFRRVTEGSGLMLHAAADLRLDPVVLQAEYAALDADLPEDQRTHYGAATGTGWTAVQLFDGRAPYPAAAYMPSVAALLAGRPDWQVLRAHLIRQPPRGQLRWHFDNQALYRDEARLLIPIHQPPGAVTLIGPETVAYPEGQCWTGDFSFPHQVENHADRERIVLAVDVRSGPEISALFPTAMLAGVGLRGELAAYAVDLWRQTRAAA